MIIHDKKKAAGLMLDMHEGAESPEKEGEELKAMHEIASEMMSAIKSGSVEDLAAALEAFMEYDEQHDLEMIEEMK